MNLSMNLSTISSTNPSTISHTISHTPIATTNQSVTLSIINPSSPTPSNALVAFLVDYATLLLFVQLTAQTPLFSIVSIADLLSVSIAALSSDEQSQWLHRLLLAWRSRKGRLAQAFGLLCATLQWTCFAQPLLQAKSDAILDIAAEHLSLPGVDRFIAAQLLRRFLQATSPSATSLQKLTDALLATTPKNPQWPVEAATLRLLATLAPGGVAPGQLAACLETALRVATMAPAESGEAAAMALGQVLEKTVGVAIRRGELQRVEKLYGECLRVVLRASERSRAVAARSIAVFMKWGRRESET